MKKSIATLFFCFSALASVHSQSLPKAFSAFMEEGGIELTIPDGFTPSIITETPEVPCDFALSNDDASFQIRYHVFGNTAKEDMSVKLPKMAAAFVSKASGIPAEEVQLNPFDQQTLFEYLNADMGYLTYFQPKSSFSSMPLCAMMATHQKNKGVAVVFILYSGEGEEVDAFLSQGITSLKFQSSERINGIMSFSEQLLEAAKINDAETVGKLLEKGANPNYLVREYKQNALHLAAQDGGAEVARKLVVAGTDVNALDNRGLSPLYISALHGTTEFAEILLRKGADPNLMNPEDNTYALDMAEQGKHEKMLALLRQYGAKGKPSLTEYMDNFGAGSLLRYEVQAFGRYFFTMKLTQLEPIVKFEWDMSIRDDMNGTVTMSENAANKATKLHNFFEPGDVSLEDASCVWVSKEAFKKLKAGEGVKLHTGKEYRVFKKKDAPEPLGMPGYKDAFKTLYIESEDGAEKIWILDDAYIPVILKMELESLNIGITEIVIE